MTYQLTREKAMEVIANIRGILKRYFEENNLTYAIFGKSEGLDSSVIAGLLSDIEGIRPIGVIMPCESDPEAERIGKLVLDHFNIPTIRTDLSEAYHFIMGKLYCMDGVHGQLATILNRFNDAEQIKRTAQLKARASGNIKARLRMITLYHIAQLTGGLVVSTDNLSELWMGFWTINGDVGDLAPIQHVFKGIEEYEIAKALGVPEDSLNAVPTDGLDVLPGGVDEDQLGMPYQDLDRVIIELLKENPGGRHMDLGGIEAFSQRVSGRLGYPAPRIAHVANQMNRTVYKRSWPRILSRSEIGLPPIVELDC